MASVVWLGVCTNTHKHTLICCSSYALSLSSFRVHVQRRMLKIVNNSPWYTIGTADLHLNVHQNGLPQEFIHCYYCQLFVFYLFIYCINGTIVYINFH